MQANTQTTSVSTTTLWADSLIIALAILWLCCDGVIKLLKRGLTVAGTVQIDYAESLLFGLCLLSLLVVLMK